MKRSRSVLWKAVHFLAALFWSSNVFGEVVTFDLVPAESIITISGDILGTEFMEQGPGSLSTRIAGSLSADVTESSLQIISGMIDAETNGTWQPLPNGDAGSAPADYGARAMNAFATANAALRNIILDVSGPVLAVSGGMFDSSGLIFQFPTNGAASLDYRVTGFISESDSEKLESNGTNDVSMTGTIAETNGVQTLTIPVNATFKFELLSPDDTTVTITGSLVATRTVAPDWVFDAGSITINGPTISLQWQAAPGQTFSIVSSSNLVGWTTRAENITSADSNYSWMGTAAGLNEYFRLAQ